MDRRPPAVQTQVPISPDRSPVVSLGAGVPAGAGRSVAASGGEGPHRPARLGVGAARLSGGPAGTGPSASGPISSADKAASLRRGALSFIDGTEFVAAWSW